MPEGFSEVEREALQHLMRTLLPTGEEPGADDLGVADVIEAKALAAPDQLTLYRRGLAALDATSERRFGCGFAGLRPPQQEALVADLQAGRVPEDLWHGFGRRFFLLARIDTVFVYATDPDVLAAIGFPGPSHQHGGYRDPEKLPSERLPGDRLPGERPPPPGPSPSPGGRGEG